MASGFNPSGGGFNGDFYNTTTNFGVGNGNGSAMINPNAQLQYRQLQQQQLLQQQQQQLQHLDRRIPTNFSGKRSLSELQQQQLHQQQGVFMRSVKQRNQYNHTSPISPLTPFDFSGNQTPTPSLSSTYSSPPPPQQTHLQQLRSSLPITSNNYTSYANRVVVQEFESEKQIKNQLQELEKQLLDDIDEDEGDVVSVVTSSEWGETMQNLITSSQNQNQIPNPFSPSPSSSSSSSSSSSATSSSSPLNSSSKQSFIDIATAISDGNIEIATVKLDHLKQISNPRGDSEQRFISYMVSALRSRLNPTENPPPVAQLYSNDQIMATQILYEASPCFKLGFMAANLAIHDAIKDQPSNNIHVLDFDVGQGSQYISLIHAIAEQQKSIRITSVVLDSGKEEEQRLVGDRLKKLADRVGIRFTFNTVSKPISELTESTLGCQTSEALMVNFAFRLYKLSDESVSTENPRDQLLRLVKGLKPKVVNLIEQEMNCNTAPFVTRVAEVSSYYSALFNSLDSTMSRDGSQRVKIEECLGRKAANSVACEGRERVERCEVFGKWRARMRMAGFIAKPLGQHVAESMKARLSSVYKNNHGFTVKEEADGVCFGWGDRVLTFASSWC